MSTEPKLLTLEQYQALTPGQQGYAHYMQAEWPESPIPKDCPYAKGTPESEAFGQGSFAAMLACQEMDE